MPRQLALPLPWAASDLALEPLVEAASNAAARRWLAEPEAWPLGRLVLWGGPAAGKSHMLALWAERAGAMAWQGGPRPAPPVPIVVDDADLAAEEDLFHLLNAAQEAGQRVLLAAREPPARWRVALPDLASRLRASLAVEIGSAEDALLATLFQRLLDRHQLTLAPALRAWLLARAPRDAASLRELAARLDRASLAEGRQVTRALAAGVLASLPGADAAPLGEGETESPHTLPFL